MLKQYSPLDRKRFHIYGRVVNKQQDFLPLLWTGSGVEFRTDSSEVWLDLESDYAVREEWIRMEVDGVCMQRCIVPKGRNTICVFRGFSTDQTRIIRIMKESQPWQEDENRIFLMHFVLCDGTVCEAVQKQCRLEFVGDSLSSGEGLSGSVSLVSSCSGVFGLEGHWKETCSGGQGELAERVCNSVMESCVYRTVVTEKECPYLRAVHMEKEGVSWYLFSNEGEDAIETEIYIKELQNGRKPVLIRLWDACAEACEYRTAHNAEQGISQEDRALIRLRLEHCEMKLLLLLDESAEHVVEKFWPELCSVEAAKEAFLGDWTERFEQVDFDNIFASWDEIGDTENTVVYRYVYTVADGQTLTDAENFMVCGEEMVECICNGTFAGVSFYGPHTFRIGHLLRAGNNEICLRFTGNAVNLYGDVKVPFGLALRPTFKGENDNE